MNSESIDKDLILNPEDTKQIRDDILNVPYDPSNWNSESDRRIIRILELEFYTLEKQQIALFYSNEEMANFDIEDKIIVEARSENMRFIEKNLERMKQIKAHVLNLDINHPIGDKNLLGCFNNLVIDKDAREIPPENYLNLAGKSEIIRELDL